MTKWQTRREMVSPPLTMWRGFREVDGVEDEALAGARKLNTKEEGVYSNGK